MKILNNTFHFMIAVILIIAPAETRTETIPEFTWVTKAEVYSSSNSNEIAVDSEGNSYITGTFKGFAEFGIPGEPGYIMLEPSSAYHGTVFIVKIDPDGNFVWARKAGDYLNASGRGISVDQSGNCYITGRFTRQAYFGDPGEEGYTHLIANGDADIYIAKLDTDGNFQWARQTGGPGLDYEFYYPEGGKAIVADNAGNTYVTGEFLGISEFGTQGEPGYTVLESNHIDVFITKLDTDGNFLWARKAGGEGSCGLSIALDPEWNCYVAGHFRGTAVFGEPGEPGYTQIDSEQEGGQSFITKLSSNGSFLWAKALPAPYTYGIAQDNSGNSYVTGIFRGTIEFGEPGDPSHTILISSDISSGYDIYIAKIDTDGNFIWAKKAGGIGHDSVNDISADAAGNCYITGKFTRTADFGQPGEDGYTRLFSDWFYSYYYIDIFFAKLDPDGNFKWARKAGSNGTDDGGGICIGPDQSIYATGYFHDTAVFGYLSEPGYSQITADGHGLFFAKLVPGQECPESTDAKIKGEDLTYCPESPMPGDTLYISARIHNIGTQAVQSGNISFYYSLEPHIGLNLINTVSFGIIGQGEHINVSAEWTTDPETDPDLYFITACIRDISPCDKDYSNNQITLELYHAVEIDSFTARGNGDQALIKWVTASETNNLGYNLYRTIGRRESPFISFIPVKLNDDLILGRGNSSIPRYYSFTDYIDNQGSYVYILEPVSISGNPQECLKTRLKWIF